MIFIGVDPGVSGGVAAIGAGGWIVQTYPMPRTPRDIVDVFEKLVIIGQDAGGARATLERVASSPQMGVKSAFTFGESFGGLRMALASARIPYDEVAPSTWQRFLGCVSGGDKKVTKARAQQLFPRVTVTHWMADALLLAEYGRRQERGLQAIRDETVDESDMPF
jgi:hypothetical protein